MRKSRYALNESEIIERSKIEEELIALWGFNPYKILFDCASITRTTNSMKWECKNCNNVFTATFHQLEGFHDKDGYYCSKCQGTQNPEQKKESITSRPEERDIKPENGIKS
jgi:hypothetical protein